MAKARAREKSLNEWKLRAYQLKLNLNWLNKPFKNVSILNIQTDKRPKIKMCFQFGARTSLKAHRKKTCNQLKPIAYCDAEVTIKSENGPREYRHQISIISWWTAIGLKNKCEKCYYRIKRWPNKISDNHSFALAIFRIFAGKLCYGSTDRHRYGHASITILAKFKVINHQMSTDIHFIFN